MGQWRDFKEAIDYIHKTYCRDERPMFMYSVSLGGTAALRYIIEDAANSPIKAALFFGAPIGILKNEHFFSNSGKGLYNYGFGKNFLKKQRQFFPDIKKYSTPEQIASYDKMLNGVVSPNMDNFDEFIIAPMFGY